MTFENIKYFLGRRKEKSRLEKGWFVSLGAGVNQVPLIREAKNLGYKIIGIDIDTLAPGLELCDLKIQESIYNYTAIFKKLRELIIAGRIAAVHSRSYGRAVISAAYLAEKFGIPYIPLKSSRTFTEKNRMKSLYRKNGIKSPESIRMTKGEGPAGGIKTFPIICRPVKGHAKKNVKLIHNAAELREYRDRKGFLFEKFINGDEIIAAGIIKSGRFYLIEISDKEKTASPYFADIAHSSPSKYEYLKNEISLTGQKIADFMFIENSPLIMEMIINPEHNLYLIEAVPEFGGEFISDILIPARTGYNIFRQAILAMTDDGFEAPPSGKKRSRVKIEYIPGKKGKFISADPGAAIKTKGVIFCRIFMKAGDEAVELKENRDRAAVIAVKSHNAEKIPHILDRAKLNLKLRIE